MNPLVRNWINLTNGLQAIRDYGLVDYNVMRLQSTHCEQKRWGDVLASVPDEFLFRLALGDECRVFDYGARKAVPRAVWQGLEWVRYAVTRRWTGEEVAPEGRAKTMGPYFAAQYAALTDREKARLDYFGGLTTGTPRISAVTAPTTHDGDKAWMMGCIANNRIANLPPYKRACIGSDASIRSNTCSGIRSLCKQPISVQPVHLCA